MCEQKWKAWLDIKGGMWSGRLTRAYLVYDGLAANHATIWATWMEMKLDDTVENS